MYRKYEPESNWKITSKGRAIMLKECPKCGAPKGYFCATSGGKKVAKPHRERLGMTER